MDLRILKTKKSLYEALMILMENRSFEEIKVSEICEKAMVNRSTFYAHYEDKYALLNGFILDLKESLKLELNKNDNISNTKEYYMECILLLFSHIEMNKDTYLLLLLNNKNSVAMDMIYSTLLEDITKRMEKEQTVDTVIPADFISHFYLGAIFQVGMQWIQSKNYYSKEDIIRYCNLLIPENIV